MRVPGGRRGARGDRARCVRRCGRVPGRDVRGERWPSGSRLRAGSAALRLIMGKLVPWERHERLAKG